MKNEARPNPFHVLGLPLDADRDAVVRRGRELSDLADSEELRALCGWAVRELLAGAETRRVHELLEVPGAAYRDEEWEDFARRHRRRPANTKALKQAAGELRAADFDLAAILGLVLDGLLEPPPVDLAEGVRHAPRVPGPGAPPLEVSDVLFG